MKLSDYVAQFLADQNIKHVFAITGGASLHLIDSLAKCDGTDYVCTHHEQASAMAADAYARTTGNIGAAIATSGPGGTNLITGICCAWYDSVPVLYITGQVSTFRFKSETGVRQMGFQETDIVPMCDPITKSAVTIMDANRIRYELEKAVWIAQSGRPGPVLVDIPDDLQRADITPDDLERFTPPLDQTDTTNPVLKDHVRTCLEWLCAAKRPMVVLGWGVRLGKAEKEALQFINRLGLPVCPTWATADMLTHVDPLRVGTFGTHGNRHANFAIQNADLILSIGSRLDTHMIGSPFSDFGREAKKIIVDIDASEAHKFPEFGLDIDLTVIANSKDFLAEALEQSAHLNKPNIQPWLDQIQTWKSRYPVVQDGYRNSDTLNPYVFVEALSDSAQDGDILFSDTGCAIAWLCQAFEFKKDQRLFHAFNNTPMGYALPGAIGASLAHDKKRVICVAGDGGFMMNLQELSTAQHHELPLKIFVLNNGGYSMIQQTQDQWLDSRYEASSTASGLGFPDFQKLGETFGFRTQTISTNDEAINNLKDLIQSPDPVFCNVVLNSTERVIPQVKFGRPIEDPEPLLEREEFLSNMLIEPLDVSR